VTEQTKLAKRLDKVRRELDAVSEHLAALASDITASAPATTGTVDLVGVTEVAALAGVKPNTVAVWAKRGKLPAPAAELQAGRIWHRADIVRWLERQA
jgi:hypothetical protein